MPTSKKTSKTAIVPALPAFITNRDQLAALITSTAAVARIGGAGGSVEQEEGTILVSNRPYVTSDGLEIDAQEIFYRKEEIASSARRLGEADKVAWMDPETHLECIMLRSAEGGFLGGYVAVPPTHPLFGFAAEAVPAEIDVHGGISYAAACQGGPTTTRRLGREANRICHPPGRAPKSRAAIHATDYRVHDDAWWFGFTCDKVYDLVPKSTEGKSRFLGAEIGATYRDDAYVCREVEHLARQLKALSDGAPMPDRRGPPAPPRGLDPSSGAR
ncbi:hypothetical protein [Sphingomonas beigongshangi]|uniref:hypothetical protein n=1 Tax=Sphingomonas beigongshangi TaxID=2782540 RepID=UPI001AEDDD96|nr:hypothetical protein [Sphingomonas beigongshangi]